MKVFFIALVVALGLTGVPTAYAESSVVCKTYQGNPILAHKATQVCLYTSYYSPSAGTYRITDVSVYISGGTKDKGIQDPCMHLNSFTLTAASGKKLINNTNIDVDRVGTTCDYSPVVGNWTVSSATLSVDGDVRIGGSADYHPNFDTKIPGK